MTPFNALQNDMFNRLARDLQTGQRIAAIKTIRELTGYSLKEAKDWVDMVKPYDADTYKPPSTYRIVGTRYGETQFHWESYAYLDTAIATANDLANDSDWTDLQVVEVKAKSKLTIAAV